MLKITNQLGQSLELNPDTTISVERKNPLLSGDDSFSFDITYSAQAGLTDNNKIFIQGGHLVEASTGVYEFWVQVSANDHQFYAAIFRYKIVKDQIDYLLKVNFGAVVSKMKSTKMNEIYAMDAELLNKPMADIATFMYERASNPEMYPFTFFPVYNEKWNDDPLPETPNWLNEWDHAAQKFKAESRNTRDLYAYVPFFKLSYIIKKVFEYLKFNVSGSYFSDQSEQEVYIYSKRQLSSVGQINVPPSLDHMPELPLIDFLKLVADRLKISFDFDLLSGTVSVETFDSIMDGPDCIDISQYIESIDQNAAPEQKGYTVTLKVDDTDPAMNIGTEDKENYDPRFALVVGSGETPIEMEIGTLAQKDEATYSYPVSHKTIENGRAASTGDWQLRLVRYKGLKVLADGSKFPEATAIPLTKADAKYYRFLNDAKDVIITAKIPPSVVAKMKPTVKLGCVSDKRSVFYVAPKKISYDLKNNSSERITVKIEAKTIVSEFNTKVFIDDRLPVELDIRSSTKYKAYWIPEVHGFKELKVLRVAKPGSPATFGNTVIDSPTDDGGVGGTIGATFTLTGTRSQANNSVIRLYAPVAPKYYISNYRKGTFTKENDYYLFDGLIDSSSAFAGKPIWIVFGDIAKLDAQPISDIPSDGGTDHPIDVPVTLPGPSVYTLFVQNVGADGGSVAEDMFSRQLEAQDSVVKSDSIMLLIPNATKPGFVYGINPTDGAIVPLTFERTGTATYFDKDGLIQVAAIGIPRIQYDPVTKTLRGYLREKECTNQFLRSETFASPAWGTALTVLKANATPSVKAGSTMKELAETNSSGEHRIMQAVNVVAGETRFFSFYLKTGVLSRNAYIQLNGNNSSGGPIAASVAYFNLTTGVATLKTTNLINGFTNNSCSMIPAGNGVYRCVFSVTVPVNVVSIACYLGTAISTAAGSDNRSFAGTTGSILLDCAQAEKTALSSYVPTIDVPVTRPADVIGQLNLLSPQTLYTNVNGVKSFQLINAGALDIPYGNIKALALFTRELTQVEKDTIVNGASTLKGNGFRLGFMTKRGSLGSAIEVPIILGHGLKIGPENDGKTPNKLKTDDNSNNYEFIIPQIQFAKDNGLDFHYHLGWWPGKEPQVIIDYFTNPNTTVEQAEAMFKWMIQAPLRYFRNHPTLSGVIKTYDVINEPFNEGPVINSTGQIWKPNVILDKLGPGVYMRAIQYAKEADPRADIIVNEYGPEYRWLKLDAMVAFANECKAEGIPLDGFGLQFHQQASVDMNNVRLGLRILAATGLKIRYSEVAISMLFMQGSEDNFTPEMEEIHAAAYVELMNIFWTEVSPQQRLDFMTWGTVHSAYMGADVNEHAMLFKDDGTPTLAYTRMITEMKRLNAL